MFRGHELPIQIESSSSPNEHEQIKPHSNELPPMGVVPQQQLQMFSFPTIGSNTNRHQDMHQVQPNILVRIPIHSSTSQSQRHDHYHHQSRNNRVSTTNNEIIKSEPIKFEQDPPSSRASPCATVTTSKSITSNNLQGNLPILAQHSNNRTVDLSSLVTARPKNASIKCLRCPHCPFISIYQTALNEHMSSQHQQGQDTCSTPQRKKLACPGCDNVFYSRTSLQTHLVNDHQMSEADIRLLLQSVFDGSNAEGIHQPQPMQLIPTPMHYPIHKTPKKQKIYLKNVEVLKNPATIDLQTPTHHSSKEIETTTAASASTRTENNDPYNLFTQDFDPYNDLVIPIEDYQDAGDPSAFVDLIDDEYEETSCADEIYASIIDFNNKVFVKDNIKQISQYFDANSSYENHVQQSYSNPSGVSYDNHNNRDVQEQPINVIDTPPPNSLDVVATADGDAISLQNQGNEQIFLQKIEDSSFGIGQDQSQQSSTRKPCKIFIKNVDILKKPLFVQSCGSNSMSPQPTLISQLSGALTNFNEPSFSTNSGQLINTPIALPLPTLTTHQPKKIFIKNIDILKEPSASGDTPIFIPSPTPIASNTPEPEVRRNTLHLRTVDQLNLMNINEVQNLIENFQEEPPAPNKHPPTTSHNYTNDQFNNTNYMGEYVPPTDNYLDTMLQDLEDYRSEPEKFPYPIQMIHTPRQSNNNNNNNHQDPDTLQPSISDHLLYGGKNHLVVDSSSSSAFNKLEPSTWSELHQSNISSGLNGTFENLTPIAMNTNTENHNTNYAQEFINNNNNNNRSNTEEIDEDILFVCAQEIIKCAEQTMGTNDITTTITTLQEAAEVSSEIAEMVVDFDNRRVSSETTSTSSFTSNSSVVVTSKDIGGNNSDSNLKGRIYVVNNLMKAVDAEYATATTVVATSQSPFMVEESDVDDDAVDGDQMHVDVGSNVAGSQTTMANVQKSRKRPKGRRKIDQSTDCIHICNLSCAMKFCDPNLLEYHKRCHGLSVDQIVCPECKESFRLWNNLHTHLWRKHSIDMELYSCTQCNFKTPIRSRLFNTHVLTHSDERNFKCAQCGKCFKNAKQLKNHRSTHNELEPKTTRRCTQCDKLFTSVRSLRHHIRLAHEEVEQFQCTICNAVCSSKGARRVHMANHEKSKAKLHQCSECSYESNDLNAFRRHRTTHEGKQPTYRCPLCNQGFAQSNGYTRHVIKDHPDEADTIVFSCDICTFKTINRPKFELHRMNHKSGNIQQLSRSLNKDHSPMANTASESSDVTSTNVMSHSSLFVTEISDSNSCDTSPNRIKVRSGLEMTCNVRPIDVDVCNSDTFDVHMNKICA